MKREIKFRFWNRIVERMSKPYTLEELHKEKVYFTNLKELQFINVHDKNGIEIYEGDIVERIYRYEIRFENGVFFGHNLKGNMTAKELMSDFKVIGNIFENPELIQ